MDFLVLTLFELTRSKLYFRYPLCLLSCFWVPICLYLKTFACMCEAQSGQLVPLPVWNSVEVVAVHSRFICLNHQQTMVKSASGKGISRRSAQAACFICLCYTIMWITILCRK